MLKRMSQRLSRREKKEDDASVEKEDNVDEHTERESKTETAETTKVGASRDGFWKSVGDALFAGKQQVLDHLKGVLRRESSMEECEAVEEEAEDPIPASEQDVRFPLFVNVDKVIHIPIPQDARKLLTGTYRVSVTVEPTGRKGRSVTATTEKHSCEDGVISIEEKLELGSVAPHDTLKFVLYTRYLESSFGEGVRVNVGEVKVRVVDLIAQSCMDTAGSTFAGASLWIKDADTDIIIFDKDMLNPCQILLSLDTALLPAEDAPIPRGVSMLARDLDLEELDIEKEHSAGGDGKEQEDGPKYDKHVLVVTRGTRGDVQPFIALARGLAEQHNFLVTICTEDRYRPLVERYSEVSRGAIQFRTSGGDTEKRITTALARWALQQKSTAIQFAMLGHSEREFFDSEPVFFYWCRHLKPDVILFGFTTANVAMVLSEALRIPMVGFLLQPTVIPSKQYPAIARIEREGDPELSHRLHGRIKLFLENNPVDFQTSISTMRTRRGLQPFSHRVDNYQLIVDQNIPVVVPINKVTFGGKPADWHENALLTDFIFLRTGAVPNLTSRYIKFLMEAKNAGEPIIAMAFSSMPVPRAQILELAITMIQHGKQRPRVIALVGAQNIAPAEDQDLEDGEGDEKARALEVTAKQLVKQGKLLVDAGAPFSKLFPEVDLIIAHGGLGTTGEALRAAKPCITTGVLILDQRFWGRRVYELGVGPKPVHVRDFHKVAVEYIDECLAPGNPYAERAKEVADMIGAGDDSNDGVAENCDAIVRMMEVATPVRLHHESINLSRGRLASAFAKDANSAVRAEMEFARGVITSMVAQNTREIRARVKSMVSDV